MCRDKSAPPDTPPRPAVKGSRPFILRRADDSRYSSTLRATSRVVFPWPLKHEVLPRKSCFLFKLKTRPEKANFRLT
ncbi:hypothetical protein E2C01_048277 [Portunus trituberculatus]|uniref:Uncharacterized protein n=1 Tax=Portunus trituberculatus TaxID=210409 RepID=A0A5B7GA53_PORTR|nr:hypothetical protein [Portunus trituberculatus]